VPIEGVGVFGSFKPTNDQISQRCGDHFVSDLERVAGGDDVQKDTDGVDSAEGQGDDEDRVYCLADDSGADRARPEHAAIRDELQPRHGVGVGELAGPEGDEACGEDARDEAEDRGERLLVLPSRGRGQRDDNGSDKVKQRRSEEAQPDCAARGGVAVDLGEDVSEDVGDGKQQYGATDREWADRPSARRKGTDKTDLLRDEIRDEQDDDERRSESVEIFVAARSRAHRVVLNRVERHWSEYSMPCA